MTRDAADGEYRTFRAAKRFPGLDGLRALSIVMVLTSHLHDPLWSFWNGGLGVTLFFVISGFLITTLLLREEDRTGRVSLSGFYVRRAFRIIPLYVIALGVTTVLVLGFGLGEGGANFLERLPLLATFNGELAGGGTFAHSWSLGIEEKFYILWPLLAFAVPIVRSNLGKVLAIALPAAVAASFVPATGYFGIYMPIVGGCALAVAMHYRRSFGFVYRLAHPVLSVPLFVLMLLFATVEEASPIQDQWYNAHVAFGILAALAAPGVLIRDGWQRRALSSAALVYYGDHAYGIYLFHPFVGEVIDRLIAPGQEDILPILTRFMLMFVFSFAVAWILKIVIETPLIRVGRRLTKSKLAVGSVYADPAASVRTDETASDASRT